MNHARFSKQAGINHIVNVQFVQQWIRVFGERGGKNDNLVTFRRAQQKLVDKWSFEYIHVMHHFINLDRNDEVRLGNRFKRRVHQRLIQVQHQALLAHQLRFERRQQGVARVRINRRRLRVLSGICAIRTIAAALRGQQLRVILLVWRGLSALFRTGGAGRGRITLFRLVGALQRNSLGRRCLRAATKQATEHGAHATRLLLMFLNVEFGVVVPRYLSDQRFSARLFAWVVASHLRH
mmetsp:Transcript_59284/g.97948  ORF Transcript_59284/g.97948 Transcript_59284/m.97948 type:complete len:237 (-) Transcript_59284:442-1152(-)